MYFHSGRSMNPTLTEADLLEAVPVRAGEVRRGDVIVFRPPRQERICVHRVTSIVGGGVRARGDNCDGDDPWTLKTVDILGKVVAARRGGTRRPVAGGLRGHLKGRAMQFRRRLLRLAVPLFRDTYRAIAGSCLVTAFVPSRFRPRVVAFGTGERTTYHVIVGRRPIGRFDEGRGQWLIACPWRLLVPPAILLPAASREDTGR